MECYTDTLRQIITWFLESKNVNKDAYQWFFGGGVSAKCKGVLNPDPTVLSSWCSLDDQ